MAFYKKRKEIKSKGITKWMNDPLFYTFHVNVKAHINQMRLGSMEGKGWKKSKGHIKASQTTSHLNTIRTYTRIANEDQRRFSQYLTSVGNLSLEMTT